MIAAAARLHRRRRSSLIGGRQVELAKQTVARALHQSCLSSQEGEAQQQQACHRSPNHQSIRSIPRTSWLLGAFSSYCVSTSNATIYSSPGFLLPDRHLLRHHHRCQSSRLHHQRFYHGNNNNYNNNHRPPPPPPSSSLSPDEILDYLQNNNVDVSNPRHTASHIILRECPFCEKPTNGRADNMYKCYIGLGSGVYHCHRCGSGGSWYSLKKRLGGFDVQSISQVTAQQQLQQQASGYGSRAANRAMSTMASNHGSNSASWQPYPPSPNFSMQNSGAPTSSGNYAPQYPPRSSSSSSSSSLPRSPSTDRRGYQQYLRPPASHPQHGRAAAPLPLPETKLQAMYSTRLLDAQTSGPVRDYLTTVRGLSIQTLRKYGVGQASYRFPTNDNTWKEADCVTFPWIMSVAAVERQEIARGAHFQWKAPPEDATRQDDSNKTVDKDDDSTSTTGKVTTETKDAPLTLADKETTFLTRRIKVRAIENKAWQRMDPPGGGWGLFGWHTVPQDTTEIVITEGEYDAMAVYQATGRPAVSLPNGCRSLPVEVLPLLENMEKIYLWMDTDAAGQEGAETFAKKLGLERTLIVRPTSYNVRRLEEQDGESNTSTDPIKIPKDANEALLDGLDLERIIQDSQLIPHERIMTFQHLRADVMHEIMYPDKFSGTAIESLPGLMKLMQGFRRGELTVLTGPTGAGKTTFLGQVSLDLAEKNTNLLWGSFEIKNTRLLHKLLQQFAREPLPKGNPEMEDKLGAIADRFGQLPLYFLTFHGGSDVDQVLEAMDYAVYVNDVEHIILDNMQFMVSRKDRKGRFDKFDVQDIAIEKFRRFATERNVHVTLVVHPRKEAEHESLSLASIYGSAKATQEADTVLILQTDGPNKKWIEVKKNRFNGDLGRCDLYFDRQSCRYTNTPTPGAGGGGNPSPPSASGRACNPSGARATASSARASSSSARASSSSARASSSSASNCWDEKFGPGPTQV